MTVDLSILEPALDQRSVGSTVFGLLCCFKANPKIFEFAMGRFISSALYNSPLPSELGTKRILPEGPRDNVSGSVPPTIPGDGSDDL